MIKKICILAITFCLACAGQYESAGTRAKELAQAKEYEQAVKEYYQHIENRLKVKKRPEWENPYLYLLDIGDIYLQQGNVSKALEIYEEAEAKKVKSAYVNDHYRAVASWYENKGQLKEALEILKKYQDRDPELFNMMMDRLAKQLVQSEG